MPKIDLDALEKIIADMNAAEPTGPLTTFPLTAVALGNRHAHVTIICGYDGYVDVITWLHAMTHDVPLLVARIRELEARVSNVAEALEATVALKPELYVSMGVHDLRAIVDGKVT